MSVGTLPLPGSIPCYNPGHRARALRETPRAPRAAAPRDAMKFGKDLQQYKLPGWEDDYLDYKGLKYILKKLEEGVPREEVDGEFFQALEDDLEKARRPLPCCLASFAPPVRGAEWSRSAVPCAAGEPRLP